MGSDNQDDLAEAKFEAAMNQLKAMDSEAFEDAFGELRERIEQFDEITIGLRVEFVLDPDGGIERYRIQHLRMTEDGIWDMIKHLREDRNQDDVAWGGETLALITLVDEEPAPEELRPALYAAFREAARLEKPSLLLANPVKMQLTSTGDGFSISYESR